jgi:hypothetical protein
MAAAAGTLIGGRMADRSASVTLAAANVLLLIALGGLYLLTLASAPGPPAERGLTSEATIHCRQPDRKDTRYV